MKRLESIGLYVLITVAWIMLAGSGFYYFYKLNIVSTVIILISIPFLLVIARRFKTDEAIPKVARNEVTRRSNEIATLPSVARDDDTPTKNLYRDFSSVLAFSIFITLTFRLLARAGTFDSIRSPWEVLPWQFFLFFFLTAAALIIMAIQKSRLLLPAVIIFSFLFYSVTNFVYPLGYGFDPFIHQTTETYIAEHGTITPKPFFYIGQYALVNTLHDVTRLPIITIDRWLLPILLALFVPLAGWIAFRDKLAVALLSLLPMTSFAATTPQGLANALALITILLIFALGQKPTKRTYRDVLWVWLLGLAALITHPIAGVPLLIFLLIHSVIARSEATKQSQQKEIAASVTSFLPRNDRRIRSVFHIILVTLSTIIGSLALPAMFFVYGLITGTGSSLRPDALARISPVLGELTSNLFALEDRFKPLLDFVYLYGLNLTLLLLLGAGVTFFLILKKSKRHAGDADGRERVTPEPKSLFARSPEQIGTSTNEVAQVSGPARALLLTSFACFANAVLLLAAIDFSFLPLYEQSGYAARLLDLARLFLFPIFLLGLVWGVERVVKNNSILIKIGAIALLAGMLTASLYLTYPHNDRYVTEHGWSVGQADINAVRLINDNAAGEQYIVLANQSVSATALREFGFKKYFNFSNSPSPVSSPVKGEESKITSPPLMGGVGEGEQVFYYPIPTGGPLYDYYLRMVYDYPRATTIQEAMDHAGVGLGYFVVNKYWFNSEQILDRAKAEADEWWEVNGGKVYIFKFEK